MGSRSRRRGEWDAALAATTQDATWLNDSFTPNLLSQSDAASMQPVWASGTARFDDADRTLMQAAQNAPDDGRRALVESLRGALSGLRQSLQHIVDLAGSGAPGDEQRQALAAVQQAQTRLRESTNAVTPPSS
jgi:hypothetical protein